MTIKPYLLGELEIDAIGSHQFACARDYPNKMPEEIERFVRETIKPLLVEGGAWPVRGGRGTDYYWRPIYTDKLGNKDRIGHLVMNSIRS